MDSDIFKKVALCEASGGLVLHMELQQLLNLCYIKAAPLAEDLI